jgi:hypothetical protein
VAVTTSGVVSSRPSSSSHVAGAGVGHDAVLSPCTASQAAALTDLGRRAVDVLDDILL